MQITIVTALAALASLAQGTILKPAEGDQWVVGEKSTITWEKSEFSDKVDIALIPAGATDTSVIVAQIGKGVANTGSRSWTPPSTMDAGDVSVIIVNSQESSTPSSESETYKSSTSGVFVIVLTSGSNGSQSNESKKNGTESNESHSNEPKKNGTESNESHSNEPKKDGPESNESPSNEPKKDGPESNESPSNEPKKNGTESNESPSNEPKKNGTDTESTLTSHNPKEPEVTNPETSKPAAEEAPFGFANSSTAHPKATGATAPSKTDLPLATGAGVGSAQQTFTGLASALEMSKAHMMVSSGVAIVLAILFL